MAQPMRTGSNTVIARGASHRCAHFVNDRLEACLYVDSRPALPSAWLAKLFAGGKLDAAERTSLPRGSVRSKVPTRVRWCLLLRRGTQSDRRLRARVGPRRQHGGDRQAPRVRHQLRFRCISEIQESSARHQTTRDRVVLRARRAADRDRRCRSAGWRQMADIAHRQHVNGAVRLDANHRDAGVAHGHLQPVRRIHGQRLP